MGRPRAPAEVTPRAYFDPQAWSRVHDPSVHAIGYTALRCVSQAASELAASLHTAGERWLDVGCGPGRVVSQWTRLGRDLLGVDHDPRMLAHARRVDAESAPPARYIAASAYRLPCADASADGVLASLLTGCLAQPERFFAEVQRVLRPGGRAVLTFTSGRAWSLRVQRWLRRIGVLPAIDPVTGGAFRRYRRAEVEALLRAAGFGVERLLFVNCVPPPLAPRLPARWRERLCRHFIVVARRN